MTTVEWFVIPERENMRVSGIPFPLDGGRYDCMDAGGRAKHEPEPRMGVNICSIDPPSMALDPVHSCTR
jgi:hypothetical protein